MKIIIAMLIIATFVFSACGTPPTGEAKFAIEKQDVSKKHDTAQKSLGFQVVTCIDSDGGQVPNVYGEVIVNKTNASTSWVTYHPDQCSTNNTIVESYCINLTTNVQYNQFNCEYGCNSGECLPKPTGSVKDPEIKLG